MALSLAIGVLTAGGLYLILQRELVRIVFGFLLISHAVNLTLISAGVVSYRLPPLLGHGDPEQMADPLPQAFVLTSIVIAVATAIYMLALAVVGQRSRYPHDADRTDVADDEEPAPAPRPDPDPAERPAAGDSVDGHERDESPPEGHGRREGRRHEG